MFKHLKEQKLSYSRHFLFAMQVSLKLTFVSVVFFVHAIAPFIKIPYDLNLESTALYLFERNNELED